MIASHLFLIFFLLAVFAKSTAAAFSKHFMLGPDKV
jgi:hypothetical protein